jgi:subtilase family serine protease/ribosomal protein L40E
MYNMTVAEDDDGNNVVDWLEYDNDPVNPFEVFNGSEIYYYRWMEVPVVDTNGIPVRGANITASGDYLNAAAKNFMNEMNDLTAGASPENNASDNRTLAYLNAQGSRNIDDTNYTMTDGNGRTTLPLVTDVITSASLPSSQKMGKYRFMAAYDNGTEWHFMNVTHSFSWFPDISAENNVDALVYPDGTPMLVLDELSVPLPDLVPISVAFSNPTPDENAPITITVTIRNNGTNAALDFSVLVEDIHLGTHTTLWTERYSSLGAGSTAVLNVPWIAEPSGQHYILVTVDADEEVFEGIVNSTEELNNDNDPGAPIYVTPFMPELTVATSDTFITPISNTSAFGTILTYNATVHNTGSANITDVPVYFYWGNLSWGGPDWNGDDILDLNASSHLIGTVEVDIDYGDIYTTGVQYTPGQDGTYRMYVWVDPYNAIDELVEEYSNNLAVSQNYIVRPKPNLSIVEGDIAVADTTPTQGVATTITAVVRNLGGAPATGTFDVVISLDDASNVIGTQPVTNLAAYGSQLVTVGWLPDSPGFHTIYVDVDPTSAIPESSESDNQAFLENVAVYNVSLDLIVNNANSPYYIDGAVGRRGFVLVEEEGNLVVNGSLAILLTTLQPFHIRVKDQGTLTLNSASLVSANPSTPFYLEDDATLNVFGGTIDSNINIVASGSNVQVNLEDATISGNFDTTSGASVTMLAEDTTFAKALDDVRGDSRYDLIAVSTPSIRTYDSSEVYIYRKLTITVYDGQLITPYPVDGAAVDLSYALLDPAVAAMVHESGVTGPDGTVTFNAMSDIVTPNVYPSSFFVGNYVLETTFTHGAYTTWENDTVMLSPYPTLTSVANYPDKEVYMSGVLPDLDPPIYVTPSNPGRGEEVTITTTVENIGVTDAHDVLIRFMDETTGEVIADRLATVILAGSTYVPVPAVTWTFDTLGNHTVSVEVDPFDQITEFPNGDNYNSTVITVRGLADLAFPYIYDMYYSPAPYVMGHEMTINAIVHNDGDLAAPFYNVTFYSSTPSTAATRIGNVNVTTGLAAGQVATASIVWTPLNATSYNITAVIDGDDFIEETSETNNQVVGTVDVMEYSDLYISDLTFSADSPAENNTAVTVTARVHNLGGAPASYVVVNFYDGPVATSNFIDTDTITYLPSGIAGDAQVTWDATCAGRETLHHITAVAVEDIYEDEPGLSNQLVENFTVVDTRPDLTLNETDIIVLTDNIVMMKGFAMNVTVHNVGPSQAENVTVDLFDGDAFLDNISEYLANVTVWNFTIVKRDIGAILNVSRIGAGSVDVIAANSSATSSIACKGLTSNGTHELFAVVDGGWNVDTAYGWVDEFDEDDNSASISVNVSLPVYSINIISPATGAQIRPGEELFVAGEVLNTALGTVAGGIELTITLSQGGVTIGQTTMTSGSDGVFNGGLSIPANARGQMTLTISSANAEDTEVAVQVVLPASETPLWLYIVIIVIVVVAVVGGFTAYTYFVGIGKLVECGSCGAFIPEGAHKCPKCGVEFEVETAKCSACSAWIPIDAKKCPECGAEFTTGDEEGEAYEIKMRTQYDEMVGKIKEGAKKTLGQKMTDQQFQTWWATQPSHITYEEWLREEEEMRKSGSKPCPQCTTPNSVSGRVCHKCGTPLKPDAPKGKMPKEAPAPAAAPTTVPAPSTAPKETKKCPNCNMQVDVKEAVCPVCGNDFGRKEPEAPKSMPETPAPQQPTPQPVQQPGEQPRPVVKKVVRTPVPMQRVVVKKPGEEEKKEGQQ